MGEVCLRDKNQMILQFFASHYHTFCAAKEGKNILILNQIK